MEYSKDQVMSRKEYLKSKKKNKFNFRIMKYCLLVIVIILLGIYVFNQLNIYNNVTKIANKVVEESALAKTMTMYYIAKPYSKDETSSVMLYKSTDESRTKIDGSENFTKIQVIDDKLYGIVANKLYVIDLTSKEKKQILNQEVINYVVKENKIYVYSKFKDTDKTGIYVIDKATGEVKHLINISVSQMLVDNLNIYVVAKGKTNSSVIRYNLNGTGRTILSDKNIVTYINQSEDKIYFISNEKIYSVSKLGKGTKLELDTKTYVDNSVKNDFNGNRIFAILANKIYYINKGKDNTLCAYDLNTKQETTLVNKNIESLQLVDNILYYKINDGLGIYKINLENGKTEQVTSVRENQYICFN